MGKDKKNHCSSSPSRTSKESSRSSDTSNVEICIKQRHRDKDRKDKCKIVKKNSKSKHHKHKKEKIECYDNKSDKSNSHKSHSSKSCSSSSRKSSSCKHNYSFDDLYNYYKYKLLTDDTLMAGGSSAYLNTYNNIDTVLPTGYPVELLNTSISSDIDYKYVGAPFIVRESGVYIFFFIMTSDQSCQFSVFVNGTYVPYTTCGNNSGSSQMISRNMLQLSKDDNVMVRNYSSSTSALQSPLYAGGLQPGNNETFLLLKVAPYDNELNDKLVKKWSKCHLSKRKQYLFKKILEKMLLDPDLMLKGFNVHGSFYTTIVQNIATEADIVFDSSSNVNGLSWSSSSPTEVKILEDGVYKLFFLLTTNTAAQFSLAVNGVPIDYTIQGTNKGAGQLSSRTILKLNMNDIVTVKNHTSSNGSITTSAYAGGKHKTISSMLTIFKVSPLVRPVMNPVCLNEYYSKCYNQFKTFLLTDKCLQINGSQSYISISNTNHQKIALTDLIDLNVNNIIENITHIQGTSEIVIHKDGIYDIFADIITTEPSQFTVFVNGIPNMTTTNGRDSGGNRCIVRQFVKLSKGDVVTIRNYESNAGALNTEVNTGGTQVGHPVLLMAFMLSPFTDMVCPSPKPDCKHEKKPKKM